MWQNLGNDHCLVRIHFDTQFDEISSNLPISFVFTFLDTNWILTSEAQFQIAPEKHFNWVVLAYRVLYNLVLWIFSSDMTTENTVLAFLQIGLVDKQLLVAYATANSHSTLIIFL